MHFRDLTEAQILALAISAEEEDGRIFRDFADSLRKDYAATSQLFDGMALEEDRHRHQLIELYRRRFGEHIPLIRRQDVQGFLVRKSSWLMKTLSPDKAREEAALMEIQARRFYEASAKLTTDASTRQLLGDLALEEARHEIAAERITEAQKASGELSQEHEVVRKLFVLRFVQPGLAGLMDGSVSTLAPLFAAAFATHDPANTFKVGLAASIGAGISMGFAEALSDDGKLSGRGAPWLRGTVCGIMTTVGGLGHTLPYLINYFRQPTTESILINNFRLATTVAIIVVAVELAIIAWVRKHYMDTPLVSAIFQVIVGGFLVFLTGWAIGAG